ncbi:hypothetical protein ABT213_31375 [Streptomyces sp. NPDC001674]|uniref:hypothetical protein n=1 Tax=Streptomyces sp. NPDC001674 TaxID=3154394 RepID=UPI00332EC01F
MPIRRDARTFGPAIRIDTDARPGGCTLTFAVPAISRTYVALDIQYDPDGDPGRCTNTGYHWAETDRGPVTIGVDTDNRPGGCRLQLRLRIGLIWTAGERACPVGARRCCRHRSRASR